MLKMRVVWVPVRQPKGEEEYADLRFTMSSPGAALDIARMSDTNIPDWKAANPVTRVAHIKIMEVEGETYEEDRKARRQVVHRLSSTC